MTNKPNNRGYISALSIKRVIAATIWITLPVFADPITRYVSLNGGNTFPYTNWAGAATTIQAAVDAAVDDDLVLVSNGVYQTGRRLAWGGLTNRLWINKKITVQSVNGPGVTSIKGAWDPLTTNGPAAVRCVQIAYNAKLVGFTLTNGATLADGSNYDTSGGGAIDGILDHCIITGNSAMVGGGAAQATLTNCTLIGNFAAWGGAAVYCTLKNCTVISNSATSYFGGGTIDCNLDFCTLGGNTSAIDGGGVSGGMANNCILRENSGLHGGGAHVSTLNNCLLIGNSASNYGGGAYKCTLYNCTVVGNFAGWYAGGVRESTVNNCIVVSNTAESDANIDADTISYSCTEPLAAGTGNIADDPLFINMATTNLRLSLNSPCRDTGLNANAPAGPDFDGNPRIANGCVDMGAYEYQPVISLGTEALANGTFENSSEGVFSSWTLGLATSSNSILASTKNSPFTVIYPEGTQSLHMVDIQTALQIQLTQDFQSCTNQVLFTADFYLDASSVSNSNWRIGLTDTGAYACEIVIGMPYSADMFRCGAFMTSITGRQWYSVALVIDTPNQVYHGVLQEYGGSSWSWTNTPFTGFRSRINRIYITGDDPSSGLAKDIIFDNLSLRTIGPPAFIPISMNSSNKLMGCGGLSKQVTYSLYCSPSLLPAQWQIVKSFMATGATENLEVLLGTNTAEYYRFGAK